MTYEETLHYLYTSIPVFQNAGPSAYKPGLGTSIALDDHLGNPHKAYKTIHVAGTNGKGSVSHLLAAILRQSGYKVGLYTSPHLVDFRERIRVNGQKIPEEYVIDFVERHRSFFETLDPSFFELTSSMAFDYFRAEKVDYAVIEVGMGGRLDSTNIIPPADVDVILVAPKGSGTSLRRMFLQGRGLNSSYAIFQDATGRAWDRVIALGIGVGSGYLFETTFKKEVYSDLTGERGTLMGAIQGLLLAQYETLRENGHEPSEAFNETVEELTQSLMPLFAENGMDWMYANCSTTAQRGALDWMGPFHDAVKPVFEKLYREVACGNEAQRSIDTNSKPDYREGLEKELAALRESEMWRAGAVVRKLRPENN